MIGYSVMSTYAVFGLLGTMPTDRDEQNSVWVYSHVVVVSALLDMLNEFESSIIFSIIFARSDTRVSAVHITIFASMLNMTSLVHKFYVMNMVETFGIFIPQAIFAVISMTGIITFRERFRALKDIP